MKRYGRGVCFTRKSCSRYFIWGKRLGGDGVHAKSTRGIPSSGSHTDFGDDGAVYNEQRVGVALGG